MSRTPRRFAGVALVVTLCCVVPTSAQERLFVIDYYSDTLAELDTSDSSFGVVRRYVRLPSAYRELTPLAGGRFLILDSYYDSPAVFDTRTFALVTMPQWTGLRTSDLTFDSDSFRPRIFYRTRGEFGVMEAPSLIPRILGRTDDPGGCCDAALKYVVGMDMLLLTRIVSPTAAAIAGFDADTGAFRGAIGLAGRPGPLLVDTVSHRLHVPLGVGEYSSYSKIQTYDLNTFLLVNETGAYPLSSSQRWSFDPIHRLILVTNPGYETGTAWGAALDSDLRLVARIDFPRRINVSMMRSTTRDRTLAFEWAGGYWGSSSGAPYRAQAFLTSLDATTLQLLGNVDLYAGNGPFTPGFYSAMLLTPPPPPIALAHTISGQRVELTWRDPGDATHFLVQAGTEPGRSNLGTFHVAGTTRFTADIPPGRYYVRAWAVNDVGSSLPSNEVVVVVP